MYICAEYGESYSGFIGVVENKISTYVVSTSTTPEKCSTFLRIYKVSGFQSFLKIM
jgi:hypothetical protein